MFVSKLAGLHKNNTGWVSMKLGGKCGRGQKRSHLVLVQIRIRGLIFFNIVRERFSTFSVISQRIIHGSGCMFRELNLICVDNLLQIQINI